MTRTERLLRLARLRGDRAAELIVEGATEATCQGCHSCGWGDTFPCPSQTLVWWATTGLHRWTEAELREAWGR